MKLTIKYLTEKRKKLWQEKKDLSLDRQLTELFAKKILEDKSLFAEITKNPHKLIECCFSVVDKKRHTVPFFFNQVQKDFVGKLETLGPQKPYFILKGRQQGFTTLITAIQLSYAIIKRNFSGFTLADRDDNTKAIFNDKAKAMYNDLPRILKPTEKYNSTNELFFDKLNSSWRVASATSNIGRSRTLSFIHFSEIAFYKCSIADLQKSILEASTEDAYCIYETTANGFNDAKDLWNTGYCNNLFYEWWKSQEYASTDYKYLKTTDKWLVERLKSLKEKGLSKEQLTWYAKKYASYIDKSSIRQEYPCTPEEAFIVSGDCVFDKDAIANYLNNFNIPYTLGYFRYQKSLKPSLYQNGKPVAYETVIDEIQFVKSPSGFIRIVDQPFIKKEGAITYKKPYIIGADTAGTGQDFFTAKVLDNTSGKCVATLHKQSIDEDLFAEQLYCLGKYYNNAYIGVEINYSRHPVNHLLSLGYDNMFSHSLSDESSPGLTEKRYGFLTSSSTRPVIIANLVTAMRENLECETDRETLKELTTFVKNPSGKSSASSGSHDDLVMASAIAHFLRSFYTQEMEISDTGSDFLEKSFIKKPVLENQFMEW